MCLRVSNKKKNEEKKNFASLKSLKKGLRSGSVTQRCGSGSAPKCYGYPTLVLRTVVNFMRSFVPLTSMVTRTFHVTKLLIVTVKVRYLLSFFFIHIHYRLICTDRDANLMQILCQLIWRLKELSR
jgi:hypothetical protein